MKRRVILLAIVALGLVAGLVVYAERGGGGASSSAALYHHYFTMGERECRLAQAGLKPSPIGGVASWTGITTAEIVRIGPSVPPKYWGAIRDGCSAAG